MRKIIAIFLLAIMSICVFAACQSNEDPLDDNSDNNVYTDDSENPDRTVNINTEKLLNYYFETDCYKKSYYSRDCIYEFESRLSGFIEFSGYIDVTVTSGGESLSARIELDSRKTLSDTINIGRFSSYDNNLQVRYNDIDIVLSYHHEGQSGQTELSFKTIELTEYNYDSYLILSKTGSSDEAYYSVRSKYVTGLFEYNNVKITLNNGITIDLFADGDGKYVIPKENASDEFYEDAYIVKVSGVIDFYPPATTGY